MKHEYICFLILILFGNFDIGLQIRSERGHTLQRSRVPAPPCSLALANWAVCVSANARALEIINQKRVRAATVVQDVQTGVLVAFAASDPTELDITTPISPLSLSKLLLAASWWDNGQPDSSFESTNGKADAQNPAYRSRVTIHEMLVGGSDSAGRQAAIALRRAVGTKAVLADLRRYGFASMSGLEHDNVFWYEIAPSWRMRLVPAPAHISLSEETKDADWAESLSLGETEIKVTPLHVSRFLQSIGNGGVMVMPVAREERPAPSVEKLPKRAQKSVESARVMKEKTALRLQSAMLDTVRRGTANGIANTLEGTGWQIGGKTGSGTALLPKGAQFDGWFAGLIFDPQGNARFTVATFVRSGGYGGESAAKISADLAGYLIR